MRKTCFLLLICLKALTACAGSGNDDSLRQYYTRVHQAEHLLIAGNPATALKCYDSAFAFSSHPFSMDLFNKLSCCIAIKDFTAALPEAERLVTKGASLKFFSTSFYNEFRKSEAYGQLGQRYPDLHKQYLATVDTQELRQIRMLIDADQAVHCLLPAMSADTGFVRRMRMNDDSLSLLLMNLLQCDSCLSDDKLGFHFRDDTTLDIAPAYALIMLHQIQKGGYDFNNLIYRAVQNRTLRAELALAWFSQSMMSPVNIAGKYIIYKDTLYKLRPYIPPTTSRYADWQAAQNKGRDSVLRAFYVGDAYFDVEERVTFNYRQYCKSCQTKSPAKFQLLPSSIIIGSIKATSPNEKPYRFADNYDVLAHP